MSNEHHPTFEVGPAEEVAGEPVRLVYTRVREPVSRYEVRLWALRCAIDTEAKTFRNVKDDEALEPSEYVLTTAAAYFDFVYEPEATS